MVVAVFGTAGYRFDSCRVYSEKSGDSPANQAESANPVQGTERTGGDQNGRVPMHPGCIHIPRSRGPPHSWPHLPEHVKLAILALVEPYRHRRAGAG